MSSDNIPNMKYYVTMTDSFMSGWGGSQGRTNKFVIGTNDYNEAKRIEKNAKNRSEMKYVNLVTTKPNYNSRNYKVSFRYASQLGDIWKK